MVDVEFLGPINKEPMKVDISNLSELSEILKNDEQVLTWLDTCAVAINDTLVSKKDIELSQGDKISLLPPVCGG
ncbi:MoaD/ThiS family protein [Poseidonibacter lekithochrous]|uniref:MoaD/ThiS family protein n=1 Tax=Poseidonibacter TaxID=2321187 RepID=UPI001C08A89C|nr:MULTISPECIES: MoaD/ThiS family protein [Poseidonibacter]MBU3015433.1 MoaD/ThiS family protein [Poseidonibacter lekithochrous]MDO6828732.1 MoaD/ThiS family protein [Poseidonibacter sp. 1_MG-2023]